ncbi:MAG: hypothetical protein H6973_14130 [Gammaproteobacteria bacterium]|nr:hypothetical protein [Gammaproteobacteria bacterium]
MELMLQSVGLAPDVPDMRAPVGQRCAYARPCILAGVVMNGPPEVE